MMPRRCNPLELRLPESCIVDRTITGQFDAAIYNREQIVGFKAQLEAWAGRTIADAEIAKQIALGKRRARAA